MRAFCLSALALAWLTPYGAAQSVLPRVDETRWGPVRACCQRLLAVDGVLPPEVARKLAVLLKEDNKDAGRALKELQDLLDPLCLVGVSINPESRVKAARGPAAATLVHGQARVVLVKVANEAGITPTLAVGGDELRAPGKARPGRWLEATVLTKRPLSGCKLEYVPLRLTAHQAGKREATLKFDAGQGTQDLGFRAEVPILFRVTGPR
jgi:hypothetical protein